MANQPKNYKKFVATAATATLVASAIVPVASAASFSDIEGNTHADAIKALSDAGIIKGYEDGTFKPNAEINRGQTVKLLGRWLETKGYKVPENWNTVQRFNDLPVNAADQELVKYAALVKDAGVFNGSNGNLNYNQPMQRQQMALVLVRAIKTVEGLDLVQEYKAAGYTSKIKDLDKAYSTENVEAITALEYAGITVVENFNPTSAITRGQFASFLNRTINYEAPTIKVVSVTPLNAKQVQVKFNKAVDPSTVVDDKSTTTKNDDTIKKDSIKFTAIDGQAAITSNDLKASLSEDGKTLTLTAKAGEVFTKRFTVDFADTIKDTKGNKLEKFSQIIDTTDTVRPTVTGTSYEDNGLTLKVSFSEPINSYGSVKLFDGSKEIAVTPSFNSGDNYFTISLAGSSIPVNKDLKLTIVGATDFNGNALTPNPYETTVKKSTADTEKPSVVKLEVVNDKQVRITFSEKISGTPTVTIGGSATTVAPEGDTGTVFTATLATAQTGIKSVVVSNYTDLAGNNGDTFTKVVELKADTTAPKLVSSEVKVVDGVEKLILTFDEYVTPIDGVTILNTTDRYTNKDGVNVAFGATFTTDFETTNTPETNIGLYNPVDGKSKSVALDISSLPKGTYKIALPALVQDLASTPNAYTEAKEITFVRNENPLTEKPKLDSSVSSNGVVVVDNDTLEFTFTQSLSDSALNKANYNVDGISIADVYFYGNKQTVRVKLAPNANTVTGVRTITVSNIANTAGIVMDTAITTETLKENVAPTFTATLISDKVIKVDFSEPVANTTLASALSASNFTVKVDGVANPVTAVNEDNAATPTAVSGNKGYKTVYLVLTNAVKDLSKPITVTAKDIQDVTKEGTITGTDVVGNKVSTTEVTVAK